MLKTRPYETFCSDKSSVVNLSISPTWRVIQINKKQLLLMNNLARLEVLKQFKKLYNNFYFPSMYMPGISRTTQTSRILTMFNGFRTILHYSLQPLKYLERFCFCYNISYNIMFNNILYTTHKIPDCSPIPIPMKIYKLSLNQFLKSLKYVQCLSLTY